MRTGSDGFRRGHHLQPDGSSRIIPLRSCEVVRNREIANHTMLPVILAIFVRRSQDRLERFEPPGPRAKVVPLSQPRPVVARDGLRSRENDPLDRFTRQYASELLTRSTRPTKRVRNRINKPILGRANRCATLRASRSDAATPAIRPERSPRERHPRGRPVSRPDRTGSRRSRRCGTCTRGDPRLRRGGSRPARSAR